MKRIVFAWGTDTKILLLFDNAANIKAAIINELRWKHLGCFAHNLNLVTSDALLPVIPLLDKVSDIVSHFKWSRVANGEFHTYQRNCSQEPNKLLQDVRTRRNSTYYIVSHICELEDAVWSTVV